jgi:hypothetical protein
MVEQLGETRDFSEGAAKLLTYVGASQADAEFAATCYGTAVALVDDLIGTATVPEDVKGRCYLEAGSELFHRRQAPNGITQFATPEGASPVRIARDPLTGVYPLLTRYLGLGFA